MPFFRKYRKLKITTIVIVVLSAIFFIYVEIVNRNSHNMTYRQKILKAVYPLFMWANKQSGKNTENISGHEEAPVSFYTLKAASNSGDTIHFDSFKGKKILLVNTASNCGFTDQYRALQELSDKFKDSLVVLGFPSNDFKEQEKGTDSEIAQFCKLNYGVTFPLFKKSVVINSDAQNNVYQWLTKKDSNGWNDKVPVWNFTKYLVDENGQLTNYFGPSVSPLSEEVLKAIR